MSGGVEMKRVPWLLPVYIGMILVMFILPRFSMEGYSILRNTTSQLGAQNTPNAWVMNGIFVLLGLACIVDGWTYLRNYWFQNVVLTVFGVGLILTAIYSHAPIEGVAFDVRQDQLHSLFATIVGLSFTLFAFSCAFIGKSTKQRLFALLAGVIATILSMFIFSVPAYAGVWQRLMFLLSFAWLILFLTGFTYQSKGPNKLKSSV